MTLKTQTYNGRCFVVIYRLDGSKCTKHIHQMVAGAFIPRPDKNMQVAHGDGNPLNNHVSNLRWATAKENNADKFLHGTMQSKLTLPEVQEIIRLYGTGRFTQLELAQKFGVGRTTAQSAINGKTWQTALTLNEQGAEILFKL